MVSHPSTGRNQWIHVDPVHSEFGFSESAGYFNPLGCRSFLFFFFESIYPDPPASVRFPRVSRRRSVKGVPELQVRPVQLFEIICEEVQHKTITLSLHWVCPLLPVTFSKQLSLFLDKAFTNHHHPLLQVLG